MKATKHGAPWGLIHSESFATRREAVQRELHYKTGRGRDELDRLELERSPRRQVAGSNPVAPILIAWSDLEFSQNDRQIFLSCSFVIGHGGLCICAGGGF